MKRTSAFAFLTVLLGLLLLIPAAWGAEGQGAEEQGTEQAAEEQGKEAERLRISLEVLREITRIPEEGIPPVLLRQAEAIAIIPSVYKVGFVVGGRFGKGVLAIRNEQGNWSNPIFITLAGGSVGWQIGAQATDLILVFKDRGKAQAIMDGKFTLGADASVAAGPVGRKAGAATDITLESEIYSYSRSRGLFAGLALEGAVLEPDEEGTRDYYGQSISGLQSLKKVPPEAREIKQALQEYIKQ